jgi:two-component system, NtrC family, response regulator HydG
MIKDANKMVMIVDDEKIIREFFRSLLSFSDIDLSEAEDGFTAIKLAKEKKFDVFFIDMRMPGINGLETSRQIRKIDPAAKIIIITGYALSGLIKQAQEEGYPVLSKPFDIKVIEGIISSIK